MKETKRAKLQGVDAAEHVRTFVDAHGRPATTVLAGGALAAIGALLPFAHVNGMFGSGESYSIVEGGVIGLLLVAIPVLLAIFPIMLKQYATFTLSAFGLSCALFGVFFAIWLASSGIVSIIGAGAGGLTIGFYLTILGYGAMVVGYYSMQGSPTDAHDADE
ncbi:MAG: hypothetical protein ACYDDA_08135 [Acidiferrobacteraceae bacterium]